MIIYYHILTFSEKIPIYISSIKTSAVFIDPCTSKPSITKLLAGKSVFPDVTVTDTSDLAKDHL